MVSHGRSGHGAVEHLHVVGAFVHESPVDVRVLDGLQRPGDVRRVRERDLGPPSNSSEKSILESVGEADFHETADAVVDFNHDSVRGRHGVTVNYAPRRFFNLASCSSSMSST